jgi:hypothetical protein
MKTRIIALLMILLTFNVYAEEPVKRHTLQFGLAKYQKDNNDDLFEFDVVEEKLTSQLSYQYAFNPFLSARIQRLETTSTEFSSVADARDLGFGFKSLAVLANVQWPMASGIQINAFAGMASTETKYDGFRVVEGDILIADKKKDTANNATFGVGVKYQFESFEVGFEKQWLEIEHLDLELMTFIVGYRF